MHQGILHVFADFGYQVYPVDEQFLEQVFADIAFVPDKFPEYFVVEVFVFQGIPVVDIGLGKKEAQDFALFVDDDVELEPEEPPHRALPFGCHAFKCFIGMLPFNMANTDWGRIDERNASAFAKAA
jgi:hypothetical protein